MRTDRILKLAMVLVLPVANTNSNVICTFLFAHRRK